jgi:hypothetical protein
MAHIVDCLLDADQEDLSLGLGLNNYIAKAVTHKDSNDSVCKHPPTPNWLSVSVVPWTKLTLHRV